MHLANDWSTSGAAIWSVVDNSRGNRDLFSEFGIEAMGNSLNMNTRQCASRVKMLSLLAIRIISSSVSCYFLKY